jgi:hypothetical protein
MWLRPSIVRTVSGRWLTALREQGLAPREHGARKSVNGPVAQLWIAAGG